MSRASVRAFYMLLGGAVALPAPPAPHDCLPYTKPHHLAADVDLTSPREYAPALAADTNLCEAFTN